MKFIDDRLETLRHLITGSAIALLAAAQAKVEETGVNEGLGERVFLHNVNHPETKEFVGFDLLLYREGETVVIAQARIHPVPETKTPDVWQIALHQTLAQYFNPYYGKLVFEGQHDSSAIFSY